MRLKKNPLDLLDDDYDLVKLPEEIKKNESFYFSWQIVFSNEKVLDFGKIEIIIIARVVEKLIKFHKIKDFELWKERAGNREKCNLKRFYAKPKYSQYITEEVERLSKLIKEKFEEDVE